MSDDDLIQRFEELEAGRILGDLDEAEFKEWQELSKDPCCQTDGSLELMAAAIETEFLESKDEALPAGLLVKLQEGKAGFVSEAEPAPSQPDNVVPIASSGGLLQSARLAWGIAALFALLFVARVMLPGPGKDITGPTTPDPIKAPTPKQALAKLEQEATDLYESDFGGLGTYEGMSGKVTWSDAEQEGYMTLTQLPANDPQAKQYQLWIVDPERDEKPVDGGVFDIPAGEGTVIVPIRSALAVNDPKAFVITLEQPGGVVVSKQETVVALAGTL